MDADPDMLPKQQAAKRKAAAAAAAGGAADGGAASGLASAGDLFAIAGSLNSVRTMNSEFEVQTMDRAQDEQQAVATAAELVAEQTAQYRLAGEKITRDRDGAKTAASSHAISTTT